MRNTKSTRTPAPAAVIRVESPGMSKRVALPVDCARLMPVWVRMVVVSNAAVPGRPGVSLNGKASLYHCQMSTERVGGVCRRRGPEQAVVVAGLPVGEALRLGVEDLEGRDPDLAPARRAV